MVYNVFLKSPTSTLELRVESDKPPKRDGPDMVIGECLFAADAVVAVVPATAFKAYLSHGVPGK